MATGAGGPVLRARVDDLDVVELHRAHRAFEERALARPRLHEAHPRGGQRDGEHEAREARAWAEVGDRRSAGDGLELERAQAVGEVNVARLFWVAHGRRRGPVGRDECEQGGVALFGIHAAERFT